MPRAFDARTGAKLWEFSSVAQPGTVGHDTWDGDSWKGRLGANVWPFYFTIDEQRGLLYLPLASPIPGAFGGDRKGANLFGNSVVAVNVQTGKYKWHFQTIHHDLWDHDPPAPPGLFDVVQNGRTIPALGVTTKSGYLYILNRETGRPIFGVEERPMPKSDVPGESAFPTQPIPVKPPALARVAYNAADLVTAADTTPEHAKACAELDREDRRRLQRRTVYTMAVPGRGRAIRGHARVPGRAWRRELGRHRLRSHVPIHLRGHAGRRRSGIDGKDQGGIAGAVRKDDAGPKHVRRPDRRRELAVPETTMGPPDGDQHVDRRIRVADPARDHRATSCSRSRTPGRPALAGPIVTASGLLFIASTDDNRFRAFEAEDRQSSCG